MEIMEVMKEVGSSNKLPEIEIGTIVHVEETEDRLVDIKVKINDLEITKDNLYISDHLIKEHKRKIRTDTILKPKIIAPTNSVNDGGRDASSHLHELESLKIIDSNIYTRDTLKVGDLVSVLATRDRQTYFVLNRMVRL